MLNTTSLQRFRERLGITQSQLGESIGVTRQTIAAWEKGEREPSLAQLNTIAIELSVPIDLFLDKADAATPTLLFRADNADVLSKEIRLLSSRLAEDYASIEKLLNEIPTVPESRPLENFDEALVERVANDIRDWLGIEDAPLGDALALLEARGLKVIKLELPNEVSGFSAYTEAWGGIIFLNQDHNPERLYFTALHELGHLIFHRIEYSIPAKKVAGSDPREKIANRFSGAVLLSQNVLKEELRGYEDEWIPEPLLVDMKERYNVSIRTIIIRSKDLGVISKKQCNKQLDFFDEKYTKYAEPGTVHTPKPLGRLKRLVYKGLLDEKITTSRAAEILRTKPKEVRTELEKWIIPDGVSA